MAVLDFEKTYSVGALTAASAGMRAGEVLVWDPLIRSFHWSRVAAFTIAFGTGDEFERIHIWAR